MQLHVRADKVAGQKHAILRKAIELAEHALGEFETGLRSTTPAPRHRVKAAGSRRYGADPPPQVGVEPRVRVYDRRALREAWDDFRLALVDHLDRERATIPELCTEVIRGGADTAAVTAAVVQFVAEHKDMSRQHSDLRQISLGIDPVRFEFDRVLTLYEEHARYEDTEIYPEMLELVRSPVVLDEDSYIGRYQDADGIAAALRESIPERQPEPPRPESWLDRLKKVFRR